MHTYLNLFPLAHRRKQLIFVLLRQWALVWLIVLGVLALWGWSHWSTFRTGRLRLAALRQEYEPIKQASDQVERHLQIIQDLQQREGLVLELADEQSMFTLIGLLSRAAAACEGRVSIQQLLVKRELDKSGGEKLLTLTGLAAGNQDVASFVDELRRINSFERVELKNTGVSVLNGIESRTYNVECTF